MARHKREINLSSSVLAALELASELHGRLWGGSGEVDTYFTVSAEEPRKPEGYPSGREVSVNIHHGKIHAYTVKVWLTGGNVPDGVFRWLRASIYVYIHTSEVESRSFTANRDLSAGRGRWVIDGLGNLIAMREAIAPAVQEALRLPRPRLPR